MIGCAAFDLMLEESAAAGSDPAANAEFLRHIAACPACMAVFVGYSRAGDMARAAYDPRDEGTVALPDALVHAIVEAAREDRGEALATFDVA